MSWRLVNGICLENGTNVALIWVFKFLVNAKGPNYLMKNIYWAMFDTILAPFVADFINDMVDGLPKLF